MNNDMLLHIGKIAFVDCREPVAKALSMTRRRGDSSSNSDVLAVSPVVKVFQNNAIMLEQSTSKIGSLISEAKESGCACPVLSVRKSLMVSTRVLAALQ